MTNLTITACTKCGAAVEEHEGRHFIIDHCYRIDHADKCDCTEFKQISLGATSPDINHSPDLLVSRMLDVDAGKYYTHAELMGDIEELFNADGKPKSVICGRCATMVTTGTDCKCGYIGRLMDYLLKERE